MVSRPLRSEPVRLIVTIVAIYLSVFGALFSGLVAGRGALAHASDIHASRTVVLCSGHELSPDATRPDPSAPHRASHDTCCGLACRIAGGTLPAMLAAPLAPAATFAERPTAPVAEAPRALPHLPRPHGTGPPRLV